MYTSKTDFIANALYWFPFNWSLQFHPCGIRHGRHYTFICSASQQYKTLLKNYIYRSFYARNDVHNRTFDNDIWICLGIQRTFRYMNMYLADILLQEWYIHTYIHIIHIASINQTPWGGNTFSPQQGPCIYHTVFSISNLRTKRIRFLHLGSFGHTATSYSR